LGGDGRWAGVVIPIKAYSRSDAERRASVRTSVGSSRTQTGRSNIFEDDTTRQKFLQVLREAAELRKASTELDERLARIIERLG
jgi:hypothetical protein